MPVHGSAVAIGRAPRPGPRPPSRWTCPGFLAAALLALAVAQPSEAAFIEGVSILDTSHSPTRYIRGGYVDSFQTSHVIGSVRRDGGAWAFPTIFRWNNAIRVVQPEGPDFALTNPSTTSYDLRFTVSAFANEAYRLTIDTGLRGYATVRGNDQVRALPGTVSGLIDTNLGDGRDTLALSNPFVHQLSIDGNSAGGNNSTRYANVATHEAKRYEAGVFTGTRAVGLRFTTAYSPALVYLQDGAEGEAAARFGLDPLPSGEWDVRWGSGDPPPFDVSRYPGGDGDPAVAHGHFVTVRVFPLAPSTIYFPVDVTNGVFTFDVPAAAVGPDLITYIDPDVAIGYDYRTGPGDPNFASVLLPDVGDGEFLIEYLSGGQLARAVATRGVHFFFPPGGVNFFRVTGIEASAGLDPNDTAAFLTGLSFVSSGRFTGTMTPLVAGSVASLPEPSSWLLVCLGGGLAAVARRRPNGQAGRGG